VHERCEVRFRGVGDGVVMDDVWMATDGKRSIFQSANGNTKHDGDDDDGRCLMFDVRVFVCKMNVECRNYL
jgi:hypothetical protein